MVSNPFSPECIRIALQCGGDPNGFGPLDATMKQKLITVSVANMKCSVSLADPSLYDCPLIGCSDGFETLTGYSKSEVVGRNCRFLNERMPMEPKTRQALRSAIADGTEFIGILPNVRKNGEKFRNFLHMTSVNVGGHRYIVGIQSDVTDVDLDLTDACHLDDLRQVAEKIFSANVDAWVQMQAHKFNVRLTVPYAEIVKNYAPEQYEEAQGKFVAITGQTVHNKNTFLHIMESTVTKDDEFGLKKSASDPLLLNSSSCNSSAEEVPSTEEGSHSRFSSSDEGEGSRTFLAELKSVGSVGHPDRCTECSFYFFRAQGCTKGSDCRFCHEFHPRTNLRKNRRLLKRMTVGGSGIPEANVGGASTKPPADLSTNAGNGAIAEKHIDRSENPEEQIDASILAMSGPEVDVGPCEFKPMAHTGSPKAAESSPNAVISLRYLRCGPEVRQAKLTLAIGQRVHLPAWVEMHSYEHKELQNMMSFTVDPPLLRGLSLDAQNGLISGVPKEEQPRKLHIVTASTAATGPGGINLGLVPLARTSLLVRVVDLSKCQATWVCEAEGAGDERILVEFKVSPSTSDSLKSTRSANRA